METSFAYNEKAELLKAKRAAAIWK